MPGGSILIDHYRHPQCRGEVESPTRRNESHNRKCGDRITLTSRPDDHGMLEIRFDGQGCMYCLASASILCSTLSGMNPEEARSRIALFRKWLRDSLTEEGGLTDEMRALGEVKAFPMRIDCADLAWKCADRMLQHDE